MNEAVPSRTAVGLAMETSGLGGGPGRVCLEPGDGLARSRDGGLTALRHGAAVHARSAPGEAALLPGGWYWLDYRIHSAEPGQRSATLSAWMPSGAVPSATFPLPEPGRDGRVACLVMFPYAVCGLSLVPSLRRGHFRVDGLHLRRLTRGQALLRMLHAGGRSPGWTLAASWAFLRGTVRGGASDAASALYRAYRSRFVAFERSYASWVARYDTLTAADLDVLRRQVQERPGTGPTVSILVPVYNTPEALLRRCIESVLAQTWPHWELCICDDASSDPGVARVLARAQAEDPRIRVVRRDSNGHISAASNDALALATGEWVALLDHDDELRPYALQLMVQALEKVPGARFGYSDEDKIDADGRRFDPYFKPAWDRELLLGQNYLCHFSVVSAALVREVGGFRRGFEGSQDHDLFLRCTARLDDAQVVHVPRVLYHWRAVRGSTALGHAQKDYASEAGERAVADHLASVEPGARVETVGPGHYRVRRPLPEPAPRVTVIVPTRDRLDLLRTCVESLLQRTRYPAFDVLVVDNQSREPETLDYLQQLAGRDRVRVMTHDQPFNYSAINNRAVASCDAPVVCLLNNDIEVIDGDWLGEMVARAMAPRCGAVGARLLYPDRSLQHAGVVLGVMGVANHAWCGLPADHPGHGGRARVAQQFSAVTGACLVVRRSAWEAVGGLDESLAVAFNDIDFCLRLRRRGYVNVWTPFATLVHHESASRGRDTDPVRAARFLSEVRTMEARWAAELAADPAYNPNLTLDGTDFGLAFPPGGPAGPDPALSIGRTSIVAAADNR